MLITITNPKGIDGEIAKLQKEIHDRLKALWGESGGLADNQIKCYPRIFRNQRAGGMFVPEIFDGGKDYKELSFDDIAAYSFFGRADRSDFNSGAYTTNVYLVFRVNLDKVKPSISHRADEEVRLDVEKLVWKGIYGFTFQSTETGMTNAFREYPVWLSQKKYDDMHPYHVFRLNFQCRYDIKS